MPSTIVKIRERKQSGTSSADSGDWSEKSPNNGSRRQNRLKGDSDLDLRPAATRPALPESSLLTGMSVVGSRRGVTSGSGFVDDAQDRHRSVFRRVSNSHGAVSSKRVVLNERTLFVVTVWGFISVGLALSFIFVYWFNTRIDDQSIATSNLVDSALVVGGAYFSPLMLSLLSFNASLASSYISSTADYAKVSSIAFPFFDQFTETIEEILILFDAADTLRVRPSLGPLRITACLINQPDSTNTVTVPTIYSSAQPSCDADETQFCLYGLMCEDVGTTFDVSSTVNLTIVPFLYIPAESPETAPVPSISLQYPSLSITGKLSTLSAVLYDTFPDELVFVVVPTGEYIASSRPGDYPQVFVVDGSVQLAPSLYTLDHSWVSLLPNPMRPVSASGGGWMIQTAQIVDSVDNAYVVVVTETSDYTSQTLFALGITYIVIGALLPMLYFFVRLVMTMRFYAQVYMRS